MIDTQRTAPPTFDLRHFKLRGTEAMTDLSADLPHQQNDRARPCRELGCTTVTTRAHAVCASHVRPSEGFGCCPTCKPAFFPQVAA